MLTALTNGKKAVGLKQSCKAVKDQSALRAYLACDADDRIRDPLIQLCRDAGVELVEVATMELLGRACGIRVGAAAAVALK